ncbi:MAG: FdtA/QdtA family cupin domain-containing protein [Bacteroidota bacterium]
MNHPFLLQFDKMGSPEIGYLSVVQYEEYMPFEIKRVFWNYAVPDGVVRGNHAYFHTQQVLVALHGTVKVSLETPQGQQSDFTLMHPHEGLFVPPHCWRKSQFFGQAVLVVFSSHVFDAADNLRDYDAFHALKES